MSHTNTTILIIQGSFQLPIVYTPLLTALQASYPTLLPALPSLTNTTSPTFPNTTLLDDAAAIRSELVQLIEKEAKKVVVVMHSYGGLVGCEAVDEELSWDWRRKHGREGGVVRLFYVSAFVLRKGESSLGVFGETGDTDVRPDGRFYLRDGAFLLYNDLPSEEAKYWESQLIPQSYAVRSTNLTRASYEYIESTYLICENDKVFPVKYQEMLAAQAKSSVQRCSAGHSPMLGQLDMLVERIVGVVKEADALD